jgi:hypothetical protein
LLCADISNIRCTLECPSIKLGLQSNGGYNNDPITTAAMMLAAQEPICNGYHAKRSTIAAATPTMSRHERKPIARR